MDIMVFVIFLIIAFCVAFIWKVSEVIVFLGTAIASISVVIAVIYAILHFVYFYEGSEGDEMSVGETILESLLVMGLNSPILGFVAFYLPQACSQMGDAYIGEFLSFFFKLTVAFVLHYVFWAAGWMLTGLFSKIVEVFPIVGAIFCSVISIGIVVLTIWLDTGLIQGIGN